MPKWLDDAVFYEIYPQSFLDSNADGIGDLRGIIARLDYIRELGCNAIWLNPCFASPFGDAGYDVSDYYTVAPRYGTNQDLKDLFAAAHERGMHVLLDLVAGHTSVEHPWFRRSMEAAPNEFTDRYIWTDSIKHYPGDMDCLRGISQRDGCAVVNFFSHQPALNYGYYRPDPEQSWQQAMDAPGPQATVAELKNIIRFWLSMGCDGFRVDMAHAMVKGDSEGEGTIRLWQGIFAWLEQAYPEAAMVSEWGEPDKSLLGGFHMDFLLHFGPSHYNDLFRCEQPWFSARGKGVIAPFLDKYRENLAKAGGKGLICIPSGNHDMDRLARTLSQEEMKIAFAFLLSMPGAPFIYYGDEIGMAYVEGLASVEGGYVRTGSRSPMQWDDSANAGFSAAGADRLYIPLDPDPGRPTVRAQMADRDSLYHTVKDLIALRQAHPALQSRGEITFLDTAGAAYPLCYIRSRGDERILVVLNPSDTPRTVPAPGPCAACLYALGGQVGWEGERLHIPARSAGLYTL